MNDKEKLRIRKEETKERVSNEINYISKKINAFINK